MSGRSSWLQRVIWRMAWLRGETRPVPKEHLEQAIRRLDFPTSTQRMGVRLTDRLRDLLRLRWLRPHRPE